MHTEISRRKFISQLGITVIALPVFSCNATKKAAGGVPGLRLGYSAITWGGNDIQAIKDIAGLGFTGIQLRSNILKDFGSKPEEIRALLQKYKT